MMKNNVTELAVLQRVNRKLSKSGERLQAHRGQAGRGFYFHVDDSLNAMIDDTVDLELFARKIGALKDSEAIAG